MLQMYEKFKLKKMIYYSLDIACSKIYVTIE